MARRRRNSSEQIGGIAVHISPARLASGRLIRSPGAGNTLSSKAMREPPPTPSRLPGTSRPTALICLLLLLTYVGLAGSVQAATLTAAFNRDTITLGDSVEFSLSYEGVRPTRLPDLPDVPGLNFSSPPGQGLRTYFVNGSVSSSLVLSYTVTPSKDGEFTVP